MVNKAFVYKGLKTVHFSVHFQSTFQKWTEKLDSKVVAACLVTINKKVD